MTISQEQIREYQEFGATCVRGMIDQRWVGRLREVIERAVQREAEVGPFKARHSLLWQDDVVRDFVFRSPVAQIARDLMHSTEIRYYFDQIFVKEPGTDQPTPWHQDVSYWPVEGRQVCSVWVALDHVTRESSGLQYVAGSHRWAEHAVAPLESWGKEFIESAASLGVPLTNPDTGLAELPDIDADPDRFRLLDWEMEPGDCLVHQMSTVHGASGNVTRTQRRRALAIRFLGDDARYREPNEAADKNLIVAALEPGARMKDARFPVVIGAGASNMPTECAESPR